MSNSSITRLSGRVRIETLILSKTFRVLGEHHPAFGPGAD